MDTATSFEAKPRFEELPKQVGRVEKIVPAGSERREQARKAVDALISLQLRTGLASHGQAVLSDLEVRSAIEEGRRSRTA
jgi:hypothetical protein